MLLKSALRDVGMNQTSVASNPRNPFPKILRFIPLMDTAQSYILTEKFVRESVREQN